MPLPTKRCLADDDYRTFGYRRIKVLRPLRMSLVVNAGLSSCRGKGLAEALRRSISKSGSGAFQQHMGARILHEQLCRLGEHIERVGIDCGATLYLCLPPALHRTVRGAGPPRT